MCVCVCGLCSTEFFVYIIVLNTEVHRAAARVLSVMGCPVLFSNCGIVA